LLPDTQQDDGFYMVADGEEIQIAPVENDDVSRILAEKRICLGKGPASCTNTIRNACDRSNLFKSIKKVLKSIKTTTETDYIDPLLQSKIHVVITSTHPTISTAKAAFLSKGIVKITRSLARVVNFQIVAHGFERIGVYPLSARRCIGNCDLTTLEQYDSQTIDHIISSIPQLSEYFLDEAVGGQLTEEQMDAAGIPTVESNDRRVKLKDLRSQSHQRAVLISNPASRKRRKDWIESRNRASDRRNSLGAENLEENSSIKRKRAPNRPAEVIAEEKKQKAMRKLSRDRRAI
jgi:hypothetical protein